MEIVIRKNPIIASQSRLRSKERAVPTRKVSPRNAGNPVKEKIVLFREPDIPIEFLFLLHRRHRINAQIPKIASLVYTSSMRIIPATVSLIRSLPRNRHPDPEPTAEPSSEVFPNPLPSSEPSSWTAFFGTVFLIDGLRRNRL